MGKEGDKGGNKIKGEGQKKVRLGENVERERECRCRLRGGECSVEC